MTLLSSALSALGPLQGLAPEMLVTAFALLAPILGLYLPRNGRALGLLATVTMLAALALVLAGITASALVPDFPEAAVILGTFEIDVLSQVLKVIFLLVAVLVVLAGPAEVRGSRNQGEYYGLLALATVGMMVVASSRDLITLFVGLELASFSTYVLAGFFKGEPTGAEAATKYFLIGALSSAILLYGISVVYAYTGGVGFDDLARAAETYAPEPGSIPPLFLVGMGLLFAGLGFKISAVPFHMWAPDVYDGSPSTVAAFLSAGTKKMGFAAAIKVFLVGLIALRAEWDVLLGIVAVLTMTVGNLVAVSQDNVKRMLAYSSIAQAGYMMIALVVATQFALAGGVFHFLTHAVMKAGAFLVVAAIGTAGIGVWMDDYRGLARRNMFLALAMAVFLVSFAGIPPFAGFASKFVLFASAIDEGISTDRGWLVWLAVAGVLNSALSLYYYARVVRLMFAEEGPKHALRVPPTAALSILAATLLVVVMGVWPQPFVELSFRAAAVVFP